MPSNKYDTVIIGAGLGGLLCAAILSKEGHKVVVLEKNKQIGGALQSFGLDGQLFDAAVHYIGSLSEGQTLYKIFKYLGIIDNLSMQQLDKDCFDKIILHDQEYKLAQGYDNYVETLASSFPSERKNINAYIDYVLHVCKHFPLYNLRLGDATEKIEVSISSLQYQLSQLIQNPILQQIVTGNNLLHAGTFAHTPFYLHALIANSYIESSYKLTEGSAQLAKLLHDKIKEHGGEIIRNCEVKSLVENDGNIVYVQDSNGERYCANHFISNLHPQITLSKVVSSLIKPVTIKRITSLKNTLSSFVVNISLKEKMIAYRNHNIYYHQTQDAWKDTLMNKEDPPTSFGIFFTKDKLHPTFCSAISILTYMPVEALAIWQHTLRTNSFKNERGESYERFKREHINYIISCVTPVVPDLANAVNTADAATPLSYRDYLQTPDGAMYGIEKDTRRTTETTIATRTKVPNLFLTGQNVNLHGVLGVAITSILTSSELIGLDYLVNKINEDNIKQIV